MSRWRRILANIPDIEVNWKTAEAGKRPMYFKGKVIGTIFGFWKMEG